MSNHTTRERMLHLQHCAATIESMGKVLAENAQDAESEGSDGKLAAATMHVAGYVNSTIGPELFEALEELERELVDNVTPMREASHD